MHLGACTTQEISDLYAACYGDAGMTACNDYETKHAACTNCLLSQSGDGVYGPLIVFHVGGGPVAYADIGGCIALLDPCEQPCAKLHMQIPFCVVDSCGPSCPLGDSALFARYQQCGAQAENGCPCLDVKTKAKQCFADIEAKGSPAARCGGFKGGFQTQYNVVAPLFCGPGP
jgi:hypothetical protein